MTTKIPVMETVGAAYRFTFDNLSKIVGLIWVPMVLVVVLDYLQGQIHGEGPANFIRFFAYFIGSLLLYAMAYTAVTEQALGQRSKPTFAHIALGITEFRAFGALLVYLLLMAFFFGVLLAGSYAINFAGQSVGGKLVGALAAGWFELVGLGFLIFVSLRFSFLLWTIVVAERRISLERSWTLSQGNFWRIFGISALLLTPVILTGFFLFGLIVGPEMKAIQDAATGGATDAQVALATSKMMDAHKLHVTTIVALLSPFLLGFSMGAAAHAYRVLTRQPDVAVFDSVP